MDTASSWRARTRAHAARVCALSHMRSRDAPLERMAIASNPNPTVMKTHVLHLGPQVALMGPGGGPFVDAHDPFSEGPDARVQRAADARSRAISPEPFRVAARAWEVFDAAIPLPVHPRGTA